MLVTWSKGHVWEPLALCHHLAYCGVDTFSAGRDIYFICHMTEQDHSVEISCISMGDSSLPHVTTLKRFLTIGILIVKRKNAPSKKSYKYLLTLKNWVDWISTRRQKNATNTKMAMVNPLKNKHLGQNFFSDNVEWNSIKLQKWYLLISKLI